MFSIAAHRVCLVSDVKTGIAEIGAQTFDIVIADIKMPDGDGFDVLREVKRVSPQTEVIMITGYRDIDNTLRAMREGAFDFFGKPFRVEELEASLQRTVRFQALRQERDFAQERLLQINEQARGRYGLDAIIGTSAAIENIREQITQVVQGDNTTVLIQGETGTGKELVAQAVHYESVRSKGPFVAVDCSALPESLIESEFFGHKKGAFTGAHESRQGFFVRAHGGTLFLDEVGDMDMALQIKLLRTLETRRVRPLGSDREIDVDVRVVSASNRDLTQAIDEGVFRRDLFYRLNALTIHIPPLRERLEDIVPLAHHFLSRYTREMRKSITGFKDGAIERLEAHSFPGNVRELRNLIERATIFCTTGQIAEENFQFEFYNSFSAHQHLALSERQHIIGAVSNLNLDVFEADLIREALRRKKGNQVHAARVLGISRDALIRRMKRYDIRREEFF